jgi:hypothetical protein
MDGGFAGNTRVKMQNNRDKYIENVEVGDVLEEGIEVYGIVEINGKNICQQYKYNLGKERYIEGGPNCIFSETETGRKEEDNQKMSTLFLSSERKTLLSENHKVLYHLLTNRGFFYINDVRFYDYNASVDCFLEK